MIESNHDMIQRIAKRYDVPMNIDTQPLSREPVQRITRMDVRNAELDARPGESEQPRQ